MDDFNNTNIILVFEPDEDAEINEKSASIFVTDDAINEATEQIFIAELMHVSSLDPATIDLSIRPSTLCRIIDNDRKYESILRQHAKHIIDTTTAMRIGFELPGYTYTEPQFDEVINEVYVSLTGRPESGPIFLVKENNVISEQTFLISLQVTDSPPLGIQSATLDLDYRFGTLDVTQFFFPSQQKIPFPFELRADTFPEGTEAFQASVSPEDSRDGGSGLVEQFPTSLNPLTLSSEVFITILDNDRKFQIHCIFFMVCYPFTYSAIIIGFTNTSYIVGEGIGTLQVDVRVFNVPDDEPLPAIVELVIQTEPGSASKLVYRASVYLVLMLHIIDLAGGSDYQSILISLIFDNDNRQLSFEVDILNDLFLESDFEDFTLELRFNTFTLIPPPSNVILSPNISCIEILDDDRKTLATYRYVLRNYHDHQNVMNYEI